MVIYTDNDEFDTDQSRQQEPIYSTQFNLSYTFENKMWASIGATYYTGGRTTIEGVRRMTCNVTGGQALPGDTCKSSEQDQAPRPKWCQHPYRYRLRHTGYLCWQYRWGGGI